MFSLSNIRRPLGGPPLAALSLAIVVVFVLGSCGNDGAGENSSGNGVAVSDSADAGGATTPGGDAANSTDGASDGGDSDGGDGDGSSGDDADGSDNATSVPAAGPEEDGDDLPGDPFDIGPPSGETLDVVGVRYDDVLNFRTRPDASAEIVDTVAPQATSPVVRSAGEGRLLTRSIWWKVTVAGEEAWANFAFLGMLGLTEDALDDLTSRMATTSAPSVEELLDVIVEAETSGPEPSLELVTPIEGLDADGAQVTVDLIGLGDDALKGERLLLTFDPTFDDPDASDREVVAYELVGALRTLICGRGVADGGACI